MSKFLAAAAETLGGPIIGYLIGGKEGAIRGLEGSIAMLTGGLSAAAFLALGNGITAQMAPKPPTNNPIEWKADPNAGIPYVIGFTYVGGNIVYRNTWGKNNEYQTLITVYSGAGPIQAFDQLFVDSSFRPIDGDQVDIPDYGYMACTTQLGNTPEAAQLGELGPPGWTTASKMSGYAASSITLKYDTKGGATMTTTPNCGWTMHGVKIYDPRLDSTYPGGSGAHRADDETTWTWSENPALHALTWLIGRRTGASKKLILGVGLSLSGVLVSQFVEAANICDANGWTCGGVVYSTDDKWNVFKQMLQAASAQPVRLGAQIGCVINTPRVSLGAIGVGDVVGDASVQATKARRDRINAVVPRYMAQIRTLIPGVSDTTTWAMTGGSPIVVDDYVTFDGRQRQTEIEYSLVHVYSQSDPVQPAQLARYDIENARELGPITLPLKLKWMGYRPGDVVTVNLPELGLVNQDILILSRTLSAQDGTVTITAQSETTAKHAFALGQTSTPPPTPTVSGPPLIPTPGATAWSIAAGSISSAGATVPALVVTGAVDFDGVDAVVIECRPFVTGQAPDVNWSTAAMAAPSITRIDITSVLPNTAYEAAISYRKKSATGARCIIGPVSTAQDPALVELAAIASDGVLSRGEKRDAYLDWVALNQNWSALAAKAAAIGAGATEAAAADAAVSALGAYLSALVPGWTDATADTAIDVADWQSKWQAAYTTVAALQAAIQGLPGTPGAAGASSVVQGSADGSAWHSPPTTGDLYIRVSNDSGATFGPAVLIKGDPGTNGIGIPGTNGYVHFAYANSADGSADFSVSDPTGKAYLGVYSDSTAADSTDYHAYKWSLIKGDTGAPGSATHLATLILDTGTTPYSAQAVVLPNGGTVTLVAVAIIYGGGGTPVMTLTAQYSIDGGSTWENMGGSYTVTKTIGHLDTDGLGVSGTYTNTSGADQAILFQVVLTNANGTPAVQANSYLQPVVS